MSEKYGDLKAKIAHQVQNQFSELSGIDQYFKHVLEGFAYRYIEDEKYGPSQFDIKKDRYYQVIASTFSMTKALQLVALENKEQLIVDIKKSMHSQRATTQLGIFIDAHQLDHKGAGVIKIKTTLNWNFPTHHAGTRELTKETIFESQDWQHLRGKFPLSLEDACDIFI